MSPKDAENSTRVYVLLKGVEAIASETTFDCDYVEMDGGADLDGGFVASMHESGDVRMVGPHGVQTLRAFAVYFGEDELEYGDPVPVGIF